MITANYEMKRFLMDCGMDWRDSYLEYLPEEVLTIIYKFVMSDYLKEYIETPKLPREPYLKTAIRLRKEYIGIPIKEIQKFKSHTDVRYQYVSPHTFTMNFGRLFPYGYEKHNKTYTEAWGALPFTNSSCSSSLDGDTRYYYAKDQTDKKGQIQAFKSLEYLGVCFKAKQGLFGTKVEYNRGSIKEGKLRYVFKRDTYDIVMRNKNKINAKSGKIEFEIILNYQEWDMDDIISSGYDWEGARNKLDAKLSVECMFDNSKPIRLVTE